ncbi:hypothetical protein FBZ99_12327 [Rhizobium sp. ERR 1071]|uniref:hypothetical protein n=1 Tax=Rhizobium sp. ERR 1071 TaxID=2572677 RepID=UPI00119B3D9F|nr:hypothetical protein [Rhizobium sp. ERR1071]TWB07949.1 hypothetical protein FBZ99_12327 [Rhizobium sp. ERR1071]
MEEVVGTVAAEDALKAADPDAGFFSKAAAAVVGFEGVSKLTDLIEDKEQASAADESGDQSS